MNQHFRVEALENFVVRTTYFVNAENEEEAERLCKAGAVAYDDLVVEEGDESWLETVDIQAVGYED